MTERLTMDARTAKALHIAATTVLQPNNGRWKVPSQAGTGAYHKRSNVETVFHMIKSKFGDSLFGKTPQAQTNELLAKVVAHNLCVLIQSFYELGVDPVFGEAESTTAARPGEQLSLDVA